MENFWHTFGHQNIKNILSKQLTGKSFPHAYLFCGPEGIGKKELALEFAKKILATEKLENHPDFQILDAQGEIVMENVLNFIGKINFKPFLAQKKVAILNDAQNLNLQSSNALLKTLEEPSESSIIILISNQRLLPTIVSRCQVLNFSLFNKEALGVYAKERKLKINPQVLELSFGQISRLNKLSSEKEYLDTEVLEVNRYQQLLEYGLGERLSQIANFAEMETAEIENKFLTWMLWQKEKLAQNAHNFLKVQALIEALLALKKNRNKKLVLQGLFLKI